MSNRKLLRNQTFHSDLKCPECGAKLKWHKKLVLVNRNQRLSEKSKGKEIVVYNCFWCGNCHQTYKFGGQDESQV